MNKKEKIIYPDDRLRELIEDFYSGKLSKSERRNKKSFNRVVGVNNRKFFPDKSASCSPQQGALLPSAASFYLQFHDLQERLF